MVNISQQAEVLKVESGTVTSPKGFSATGVYAGIKKYKKQYTDN